MMKPKLAKLRSIGEALLYGSQLRGDILNFLLQKYYVSKFRRDWIYPQEKPHFEDLRCFLHLWFLNGPHWPLGRNPDFLARGIFSREVLYKGCKVLDIACGNGFFDYLFFSGIAGHIDAVDINPAAIAHAKKYYQTDNITYHVLNGVTEAFPADFYDVVIWDGAIAHFPESQLALLMPKIQQVIGEKGILVGSEVLQPWERKASDHHICFPTATDMKNFLQNFFPYVVVKDLEPMRGRQREGFFRCSYDPVRLQTGAWK